MEESQKKLIKTFVLINILLNDIEEPNKVPTKEIKQIYDTLKECVEPLEKIIDKVYRSKAVSTSTFLTDLETKFMYNINRELKRYYKL
tara:strand:+ start:707 stop:970 length:264 start_codon:yes stop_codon:yes gene_type:complete